MNERQDRNPAIDPMTTAETEIDDLRNETRTLRRRLNFWQRSAWLLLGTGVIVATVTWQRGELRRRECANSLEYHAARAERAHLGGQSHEILEQQWQVLDPGLAKAAPMHYDLIVSNWLSSPGSGERQPLAVCRESHFLAFSRGRNVLYRVGDHFEVVWLSEDMAEPIVKEAALDNRGQ